ncbi:MAG: hypothetical protein GY859_05540 [Desulfobacterales bacterium]|nr:hypothetical protein [Desulfobacterales bacterium]
MTTWKRLTIIGVVCLVLCIAFSCSNRKRFCGAHGGDISKHVLNRIDKKVAELDLDEAQNEKYQRLRSRLVADMESHKTEHKRFVEDLHKKFDQEDPDLREITGLIRGKVKDVPDFVDNCLGLLEEFYEILDKDQKAEFMKGVKEKMEEHHRWKEAA